MEPNPLHIHLCCRLVSVCHVPAQGLESSTPVPSLSLESRPGVPGVCIRQRSVLPLLLISPLAPEGAVGVQGLGHRVPLSTTGPGCRGPTIPRVVSSFSRPRWFSVLISDDLSRQFYSCLLGPTRLPESVCLNVSLHLQTFQPFSLPSSWGSGLSLGDVCWSLIPLLLPPCYPVHPVNSHFRDSIFQF